MDLWTKYNGQPCWRCTKATGRCSWSYNLTPIPGWETEPGVTSVKILACPQFVLDERKDPKPVLVQPPRKTVVPKQGQYAMAYYQITQRQSASKASENKTWIRMARRKIPYDIVRDFIREHHLSPSSAAMAFTGTLNCSYLSAMRRAGFISPLTKYYDRICELTGFDPYDNINRKIDKKNKYRKKKNENDFQRISGEGPQDEEPGGELVGLGG